MTEDSGAVEVLFAVGETVLRVEEGREAVISALVPLASEEEPLYLLAYAEGGEGVWPQSALMALEDGRN